MKASKSSADTELQSQAEAPDKKTIKTRDKFLTKSFLSTEQEARGKIYLMPFFVPFVSLW
jgi:hypothetical protein